MSSLGFQLLCEGTTTPSSSQSGCLASILGYNVSRVTKAETQTGQEPDAPAHAAAVGAAFDLLLAVCSARFPTEPRPPGWECNQLGPPSSITNKENTLYPCLI